MAESSSVRDLIDARIKRTRGIIMQILRAEKKIAAGRPSAPVDALVILSILQKYGIFKSWDHLLEQIDYLETRGYVKKSYIDLLGKSATLVDLTRKGADLMEHLFTDDSILTDD